MGGMLADPEKTFPVVFGSGKLLGFQWVHSYPFALPSLINAMVLAAVGAIAWLFLEEVSRARPYLSPAVNPLPLTRAPLQTSPLCKNRHDAGLAIGQQVKHIIFKTKPNAGYAQLATEESVPLHPTSPTFATKPKLTHRLPFSRIWTSNVILTLISIAFFEFHLGAFSNVWALFLSTPRYIPSEENRSSNNPRDLPFLFTGGLGMPASTVGVATSFLGIIGMTLQLTLYPPIQARLGTLRAFRWFLPLFAICYFIAPSLAVLPSWSQPPDAASGPIVWIGIVFVLFLQVTARTFTMPASIILLNNCSPHPSVLGTIHGLGQSVAAMFRTVGPVLSGWWYGYGLDIGMVAWGWWGVALVSAMGSVAALAMYEGNGHEIVLEGEDEEEL